MNPGFCDEVVTTKADWFELQWRKRMEWHKSRDKLRRAIFALTFVKSCSPLCGIASLWLSGKSFGMHEQTPYQLQTFLSAKESCRCLRSVITKLLLGQSLVLGAAWVSALQPWPLILSSRIKQLCSLGVRAVFMFTGPKGYNFCGKSMLGVLTQRWASPSVDMTHLPVLIDSLTAHLPVLIAWVHNQMCVFLILSHDFYK